MLVKKGKKIYQVRFKHKKVQTGSGVQDYLLTYLALLTANELRKLLRFFSAYSRASNREEKQNLIKQYKDVLFSFETLEEPAIALMVPVLLNSLSGKSTDGDGSKSTVSLSTVTGGIKKKYEGLMDRLKQIFGLKPSDRATHLTRQREQNTVGNDPALPEQFVSGQPNLTASGKRMGRLPNILSDAEQQQIQRKQNQRAQNKNLINQSFDPELDNLFNIDAGGTSEQIQKQPTQGTLLSQFVQKAPQQAQKEAQKEELVEKGKKILKRQKQKKERNIEKDFQNLMKKEERLEKKFAKTQSEFEKIEKSFSGKGFKDFLKNSLSIAKNNIKNVTPKLLKAVRTILKYYIVYTIGEKMGIIKGIIKLAPDFNSILRNRETIFKMASEINDGNLIFNILDKIKNKNLQIYNYIRNNII